MFIVHLAIVSPAIMVVTHDDIVIPRFKRLYRLRDGVAHEEARQGLAFPD